jgi:hypothetical protein
MRTLTIVILFILCLALAPPARSQGTFTAKSCNISDVNAVIHGPTHSAVDGDIIIIPAGSCTWTSGITVSGIGISIIGTGNPSSSPSTYLPDSSCTATVITDKLSSGSLLKMSPTSGNSLTRLSCMEIAPYIPNPGYGNPISINGTCTSSGCPNLRIDNMTYLSWGSAGVSDGSIDVVNNMFGVADHDDVESGVLANMGHSSWQGIGDYGDNSWASPDTFGTAQAFYLENNSFNHGALGTDTDSGTNGGGRFVCRFNQVNESTGGICYIHGTDTTQRTRGGRQEEGYGNVVNSCTGGTCDTLFEFRSGVGLIWGNTVNLSEAMINSYAKADTQRTWRQDIPWGSCDGSSVWDTDDGVTYYSGTIGSVSGISTGNWTITDSGSPGWTTNKWAPTGAPYAFHDVTQSYGITVLSNASNSLSPVPINESNVSFRPAAGDSYQILRATVCMDQATRSGGNLVKNSTPILATGPNAGSPGPVSEALDPTYVLDNTGLPGNKLPFGTNQPNLIANRDFYMQYSGQVAQTSSTAPFNGTTTCTGSNSCGGGWGTLANRPTTCTTGVGYLATDQGNWNTSGNGFGQGELFVCTATNTWSLHYTPYTYPHPLTQGQNSGLRPAAPVGLTVTVH